MNATTNLTTEDLSTEILRTLSFYDEMSLEMIFLDIDSDFVQLNQEFKTQDLLEELKKLESNKRVKKIKNTGKILPGHGGFLDRVDGIIFAVPFAYLLFKSNLFIF